MKRYLEYLRGIAHESAHEIVDDVQLLGGYKLHRYTIADVPFSAIYSGDSLIFSAKRDREETMIECWNKLVEECY